MNRFIARLLPTNDESERVCTPTPTNLSASASSSYPAAISLESYLGQIPAMLKNGRQKPGKEIPPAPA